MLGGDLRISGVLWIVGITQPFKRRKMMWS